MKKAFILFSCILLAGLHNIHAQAKLGVVSVNVPDTVFSLTPDSFLMNVKNTGDSLFHGNVTIHFKVNSLPSFAYDSVSMILPPNAVGIYSKFNFNYGQLPVGNNIVVVWPTGTDVTTTDSLTISVLVIDNTGIAQLRKQPGAHAFLFPNPSSGVLKVQLWDENNRVEGVRIFDILGREIYTSESLTPSLDVSGFEKGVYFLQLLFADKSLVTYSFMLDKD